MERKKTVNPEIIIKTEEPIYLSPKIKFDKAVFVGDYEESMNTLPRTIKNMIYNFTIEYREQIWHPRKRYTEITEFFEFVIFAIHFIDAETRAQEEGGSNYSAEAS